MKAKLVAVITGGKDEFGVYIEGLNVFSAGGSLDDAKSNIIESLELFIQDNENLPDVLKGEYEIDYIFEITGLIKYYRQFIDYPGMSLITGVNQKQLWNYGNGYSKPRKQKAIEILEKLHIFGLELSKERIFN